MQTRTLLHRGKELSILRAGLCGKSILVMTWQTYLSQPSFPAYEEEARSLKSHSRVFVAWFITVAMIASIGIVPVAGVTAIIANTAPRNPGTLADTAVVGDLRAGRFLENWLGESAAARPVGSVASGPLEVIVALEGRSLAAEQAFRRGNGLPALDSAGQRAYVAGLLASQTGVRAALQAAGARILYDYQVVYNGFAISADIATLDRIGAIAGVSRIQTSQVFEIALQNSVPFIFGGLSNAALGADGTGVTIAIIDSGVDYTHAALGGSGIPADWSSNDRTIIEAGTFPTTKVIGGTDLVGEFYDARGPNPTTRATCTATPVPDPDPLDHNGHGSHVAGIAAGMSFDSFPQGVAPGASLFAIKLFSGCATDGTASTSTSNVIAAIEIATDPDGDGDTSDHVDVINMSLGGAFGRDTEAGAVATNAAVDSGVIVVASAGNGGDIPYITGSPAAASKAISVAAGNDPGLNVQLVNVAGSTVADGNYESLEAAITPLLAVTGTKSGTAVRLGNPSTAAARACSTGPSPAPPALGSLTGKIPLIQRGVCTFAEKILNAQAAGAIAVVVYNNVAGAGPIVMGGSSAGITIPAVMVGTSNGLAISPAIDADTTFTLNPANLLPIPNRLQSFTSRGPRFVDSAFKPDVTAPGGSIFSIDVGSGTGGVSLSGTSMSSPHIAGVSALLRELHPDWSIEEIKALVMNTATNAEPVPGVPYPVSLMGAGRVRVNVAAFTESVVVPSSAAFGVRERNEVGTQTFSATLEVHNKGASTKRFSLSSGFLFAADDEGSISLIHPSSIRVGAGQTKTFVFSMVVNFNLLAPGAQFEEYDGFLKLTETTSGGDVLRVPFHMIPMARADAEAEDEVDLGDSATFTIENEGIRSTTVDIYQFGVKDPNEDLIAEGPGMPNDPDDWFDIYQAGAHTFPFGATKVIEFGTTTWGRRTAHSMVIIDVFIDVNGGGPDFVAEVADQGLFLGTGFNGLPVSGIFSLATGAGSLQFFVSSDRNQGWQTVPFLLSTMNGLVGPDLTVGDPDFDYFVVTTDLETGFVDVSDTASFNVFSPGRDASPNFFTLGAGATASVTVLGSGPGDLLVLYYNNRAGKHQSERIEVEGP